MVVSPQLSPVRSREASSCASKTTKAFPYIPLEISYAIRPFLDLQSARNLALTCKALRNTGELGVWCTLDLTSGRSMSPVMERSDFKLCADRVDSKLSHAQNALASYPFRRSCITAIRLEPSDGPKCHRAQSLIELLITLEPQVRRLEILPRPLSRLLNEGERHNYSSEHFLEKLNESNLSFSNLSNLKYGCGVELDISWLDNWLERMASLRELEVFTLQETGSAVVNLQRADHFPLLQTITVGDLNVHRGGTRTNVLSALINNAPNLTTLRIKGTWSARRSDAALQAISRAKRLRTIMVSQAEWMYEEPQVMIEDTLRFRNFGRLEMKYEEAIIQPPGWDETNELYLHNTELPRSVTLQRLAIITPPRPSNADYMSLSIGQNTSDRALLVAASIYTLRRVPALITFILLYIEHPFQPDPYQEYHDSDPEYFVPPHRWVEEGHRGAVIRHYRRSMGYDETEEELWHVRTLSRSLIHPSGHAYVSLRRTWQDVTRYRGLAVPQATLQQVYEASGCEMEFLDGGRNLQLGEDDAGWTLLRDWWVSVGGKDEDDDLIAEDQDDASIVSEEGGDPDGLFMMGPHLTADGTYADDDGVYDDEDEYEAHEPYYGYDTYGVDDDEEEYGLY